MAAGGWLARVAAVGLRAAGVSPENVKAVTIDRVLFTKEP